jgi:hypothetical protein
VFSSLAASLRGYQGVDVISTRLSLIVERDSQSQRSMIAARTLSYEKNAQEGESTKGQRLD